MRGKESEEKKRGEARRGEERRGTRSVKESRREERYKAG